jgi:hypothetical protein
MSETPKDFLQLSEQALEDIEKMVESDRLIAEQHPRPSRKYTMKKKRSNGRKPYCSRGCRRREIWRTTSWR